MLLNFDWFRGSPPGGWWMGEWGWVCGGWWMGEWGWMCGGCPMHACMCMHTHACMHTCTHMHVKHDNIIVEYQQQNGRTCSSPASTTTDGKWSSMLCICLWTYHRCYRLHICLTQQQNWDTKNWDIKFIKMHIVSSISERPLHWFNFENVYFWPSQDM